MVPEKMIAVGLLVTGATVVVFGFLVGELEVVVGVTILVGVAEDGFALGRTDFGF